MSPLLLEKLDWPVFLKIFASFAKTQAAKKRCLSLKPSYSKDQILENWEKTLSIKNVLDLGYTPPINNLSVMDLLFRDIELEKILSISDFKDILSLLYNAKYLLKFCNDFQDKSFVLKRFKTLVYNYSSLISYIEKIIDIKQDKIKDDASEELVRIRTEKFSLIRKIEYSLKECFSNPEISKYLQDTFYTVRVDRYVLPFKLDANGRISGTVYDTSDSGQTLYIEPASISHLNEKLLNVKVQEKVEILRILKDLSSKIAKEKDNLVFTYNEIIDLDFLTAQAILAYILNASTVNIVDTPRLDLIDASHPLLLLNNFIIKENESDSTDSDSANNKESNKYDSSNKNNDKDDKDSEKRDENDIVFLKDKVRSDVIPNSVSLEENQSILIISGPNAGGKTATLKLIAFLHLMLKSALLIPARYNSNMYLFENIFIELGDLQSIVSNLSTFSAHILGIKPILEKARGNDLVLLDELCSGTDPETGANLAQAILEDLSNKNIISIITTHFDRLKALATNNSKFRNGSMSFSIKTNLPSYKLILDIPGQSYGLQIAEKIGIPSSIIDRAKELKGSSGGLEDILSKLQLEKENLFIKQKELDSNLEKVKEKLDSLEQEKINFKEEKNKELKKLHENFNDEISSLKQEFEDKLKLLKNTVKNLDKKDLNNNSSSKDLEDLRSSFKQMNSSISSLNDKLSSHIEEKIVGTKITNISELDPGDEVYVIHLKKHGTVVSLASKEFVLVKISNLNIEISIKDLSLVKKKNIYSKEKLVNKNQNQNKTPNNTHDKSSSRNKSLDLVLRTESNSLDIRGLRSDEIIDKLILFLDKTYRNNEYSVIIIHGNGNDVLKTIVRKYLSSCKDYKLSFRSGSREEGADGVTIVHFEE